MTEPDHSDEPQDAPDIDLLWPVPFLRKSFPRAEKVNPGLMRLFEEHRRLNDKLKGPVYASNDDLLLRYSDPDLQELFGFISSCVFEIASQMNGEIWQQSSSRKLDMNVVGAWFQMQNHYGSHDVHNHGNCSWCGVYYVQLDDDEKRRSHERLGELNGVTRFYGPQLDLLGGAYMDAGNLYLQNCYSDSIPEAGVLCVFPSFLKHTAMPYDGEKDRVIVSFNAQVHGDQGDQVYNYSFS